MPTLINYAFCHCDCGYSLLTSYLHRIQLSWVSFVVPMVSGKSTSSLNFESITNFTMCDISSCWFRFCDELFLQTLFFVLLVHCLPFFKLSTTYDSAALFSPTSDFTVWKVLQAQQPSPVVHVPEQGSRGLCAGGGMRMCARAPAHSFVCPSADVEGL